MSRSGHTRAYIAFVEANKPDSAAKSPQLREKPLTPYSIRFTKEERARLSRDAGRRTWAEYIREKLFGPAAALRKYARPQPTADSVLMGRVLGALGKSRIANNLNQLARAANSGSLPVCPEVAAELSEACADVKAMREALLKALGTKASR